MYVVFIRGADGAGFVSGYRNLSVLARSLEGDITYSKLVYHFSRKKRSWLEVEGMTIMKVAVIYSGEQGKAGFRNLRKEHQFKSNGKSPKEGMRG